MSAFFRRDPISGAMTHNTYATGPNQYGANASLTAGSGQLSSEGYSERQRRMEAERRARLRKLQMRAQQAAGGQNETRGY